MPKYHLFLYSPESVGADWSPEEIQAIILRYKRWRENIAARGHQAGGDKLRDGAGRVLKSAGGKIMVTDGPYVETREVLGGFFHLVAESFDQAVELARDCPHLEYGTIEIREVENT
jgi:hypothetical protein